MTTIDRARKEVQAAFATLLAAADTAEQRRFAAVEASLWKQTLALGRALVALHFARQAGRPRAARYEHGGIDYEMGAAPWRRAHSGMIPAS